MLTPEQSRAARGLLDWSQEKLGKEAGLSAGSVRHFEKGRQPLTEDSLKALSSALKSAGVEFIPENGGGAGVRLVKRKAKARK